MSIEASFYDITDVKVDNDCDHGYCVSLTISHGGEPCMVHLYVGSKLKAQIVAEVIEEQVTEVQLVDYA